MTSTGKAARRRLGTRYEAKRAKRRRQTERKFGQLPYSISCKNAETFVQEVYPRVILDAYKARRRRHWPTDTCKGVW